MKFFFKRLLPLYIRFPYTLYWLAIWSADNDWKSLRITLRSGEHYSHIVKVLKKGYV